MTVSRTSRGALIVVAVIATAYALFWLQAIFTPLALALFLTVMIDGLARYLDEKTPAPQWAALPLALGLTVLTVAFVVYVVARNAAGFVGQLGDFAPRLNQIIASVLHRFGAQTPVTIQQLIEQLNPANYVAPLARSLQTFGAGAAYVLIYVGFLIASRQGLTRKVRGLFPDLQERENALAVFGRIRFGVERYLWLQTVTGALIAGGAFIAMAVLGLHNAVFWAFLIFVLGYIPVIGGAVGMVLPPLFALVQFTTWWQAAALFAALQVIGFVIGSVLLPRWQSDSLNIDPVVVLLSLAFWGAIWGVAGMFLSTPLTVVAIIILAQFPGTRWLAILLSGDGEPERASEARPRAPPRVALPGVRRRTAPV